MNNKKLVLKYKGSLIDERLKDRYLKYLWDQNTFVNLRVIAVQFLSRFASDSEIYLKLKYFLKQEKDKAVKALLERALNGENLMDFTEDSEDLFNKNDKAKQSKSSNKEYIDELNNLLTYKIRSF